MGVILNGKHTDEWGLTVESLEISPPKPKTNKIKVPFGIDLDLSEMDGMVHYENRTIKIILGAKKKRQAWRTFMSVFLNSYHGQTVTVIPDDDLGYYYYGRAQVQGDVDVVARIGKFTMIVDVQPYKYDVQTSIEDWLWDPFNFETGVIRELKDIQITADSKTVEILGSGLDVVPIFAVTASNDLALSYDGKSYPLPVGNTRLPEVRVGGTTKTLTFTGAGTLSIDFRGRSL